MFKFLFLIFILNVQAQDLTSKNRTVESVIYEAKNFSFETIVGPSGDIYLTLNQHGRSEKNGVIGYFHDAKSTCEILSNQVAALKDLSQYQQNFLTEIKFNKKTQNPIEMSFLRTHGLSIDRTPDKRQEEKCFCNNENDVPGSGLSHSVCAIKVDNYLSPNLKQLVNVYTHTSGPNCYNEALFATGMQKTLRHTAIEEINYILEEIEPAICRIFPFQESLPGDIVIIKSKDSKNQFPIAHAYTYISDELVLSKNGFSNDSPYSLTAASSVWRSYNLFKPGEEYYQTPACHGLQHREALANSCNVYSSVLRCDPKKINDLYQKEASNSLKEVDAVECQLSELAIATSPLDSQIMDLTKKTLEALLSNVEKKILLNHKEIRKLRKEKKRLLGYIGVTNNSEILSKRIFRDIIDQKEKSLLLLELHRINSLLRQIAIIRELGTSAPKEF